MFYLYLLVITFIGSLLSLMVMSCIIPNMSYFYNYPMIKENYKKLTKSI